MKSTNQLIMSLGRDVCHVSFVLVYFFFFFLVDVVVAFKQLYPVALYVLS